MNLKPGYKVKCIKTHIIENRTFVIKDDIYEIIEISQSKLYRDKEYAIIKTTSYTSGSVTWSLDENGPYYLFSDYLELDIKALRKIKLDKLIKASQNYFTE